jgi:hypothetical protein
MSIAKHLFIAAALSAAAPPARAADIVLAGYDRIRDQLVVDIAYGGTGPRHQFMLQWGECSGERVSARLIDAQGADHAREEYIVREHFSLAKMPCRPATLALRLGRSAFATVFVPAEKRR